MTEDYAGLDYLMGFLFIFLGIFFGAIAYVGYTRGQNDFAIIFGAVAALFLLMGGLVLKYGLECD